MRAYLVTGGAGFIGSNIAHELVKRKEKVIILDNLSNGKLNNLKEIRKQIKFIEGDVRDLPLLKRITKNVDFVLHQAALRGVFQSVQKPLEVNEVNITGTLNVLMAARENKVKRVVFASSSSVYGNLPSGRNVETLALRPESPYALTKLAGEEYCRLFNKLFGLKTVVLRYFNVFGPRQNPNDPYAAVIPIFINNALKGKSSEIHGNGKQSRDFTYVENIVRANLLATVAKNAAGQAFNIAAGQTTSIQNLHDKIQEFLGINILPAYKENRPGDMPRSHANISKARKFLKYSSPISFDEGLKKVIIWYKDKTAS